MSRIPCRFFERPKLEVFMLTHSVSLILVKRFLHSGV